MDSNFINRIISFFANKKKILIILLSIIIIFIIGLLYRSYATSTGVVLGNEENIYDILLTDSSNTVEVPARSSKTVYYQFSNTNKGTVKYHIGYISNNVIAKVWWDTEDPVFDTIEYGEYKFIKLKLINESDTNDMITIKPVLGFKDGGDLVVPNDITLVTGTINEVNTMKKKSETALTLLGIDKNSVKELSFEKDNIPSSDSLGSTNMNDDGSIKLWYTNSNTENMYNVYIGSDNGITNFASNSSFYFANFNNLERIYLDNIDTSNVTDMGYMFARCESLSDINVDNFDTSEVINMSFMFYDCKSLSNIDLKLFDTRKVTDMSSMFNACGNLLEIFIDNFETPNLENAKLMFNSSIKKRVIDFRSADLSKITNSESMFGVGVDIVYLKDTQDNRDFMSNNFSSVTGVQYIPSS